MQINRLKFTEKQVNNFALYYNEGHSIKETAQYFNVKYREILHYLIYFGYYKPKRKQSNVSNLCYNENYFENINTSDKAYYLGLMMSDGYIQSNLYNKEVGIALKSEDKYILDKLNDYISPKKKVVKYRNSYKWKVVSSKMYHDLQKYGIMENKSHNEYHYPIIPKEYDKDFIRGYFDGDGCITVKSTGYIVVSICGNSKTFLAELKEKLFEYNIHTRPICASNRNRLNTFYTLYISGRENKTYFKDFIYKDATSYLKRKYNKFMKIPC